MTPWPTFKSSRISEPSCSTTSITPSKHGWSRSAASATVRSSGRTPSRMCRRNGDRSFVGRRWVRATSDRRPGPRRVAATHSAVLHHRALALAQGARRVLGRHRGEQLEIIERISGFGGLLHLQQIIGPHHTPILTHRALGVEVIDRKFLYLGNDLGG